MKTMNTALFTVALAAAMVVASATSKAGFDPPSVLQCAKIMCAEMRNCTTLVQGEIVKPYTPDYKPVPAAVGKKAEGTQGVPFGQSCNFTAFMNYLSCVNFDKAPGNDGKSKEIDVAPAVKPSSSAK